MAALSIEGRLQRQMGMMKSWKKYHCVLRDDVLTCTSESKGSKASMKKDVIDLTDAHSVRKVPGSQQLSFQITTKAGKTHTFAAETNEQLSKWISALQMAMQVRRRSITFLSSLNEADRGTQYSEPWDNKRPSVILPLMFENHEQGPDDGAYSTPYHYLDNLESPYACVDTYSSNLHPLEEVDGLNDYYSEAKVVKKTSADFKPKMLDGEEVTPIVMRQSDCSMMSGNYSSVQHEGINNRESISVSESSGTSAAVVREAARMLTEDEVQSLLTGLMNREKTDFVSVVDVKYSNAVRELEHAVTQPNLYQLVNRRKDKHGTYMDQLRELVKDTEIADITSTVQFEMAI